MQMDSRDVLAHTRTVQQIEVDGQCDKRAVDGRKYCQLSSTDDVQFFTLSVHLCQPNLLVCLSEFFVYLLMKYILQ